MNKNYAIIENKIVANIVEAEDGQIVRIFFKDSDDVVQITEKTGICVIGAAYEDGKFILPSPYPSWIFNKTSWNWEAPKPIPTVEDGKYASWDEESKDWIIKTIPVIPAENAL